MRSVLGIHWKDWCWSWNSTSCEELTHWKRPWCWEGLEAGGEGDDRGWDGWMASPPQWAFWVDSGSWWWTGGPGVLWFMGSRRVGHDWEIELNWSAFLPSWYSLWLKVCSDVLPMFENIELFVFLMLSFESSLFWMCLLSEIGFTSVFCLFVSFIFLKVSFKEQKCLLMMKSNLSICSFTSHAFGVSSKSLICYQPKTTKFLFLCFLLVVL